jgi:hypothetical protein
MPDPGDGTYLARRDTAVTKNEPHSKKETAMNFTISNPMNSNWNRFKAQYLAAACGLVIAASAVLIIAPWYGTSSRGVDGTLHLPAIAGQASEAEIMAGVISTEHATYAFDAPVIVPAGQASEADMMAGILSTEHAAYAFDDAPVSVPVRQASEADIMAGVISTEHATYVFDQ